MGIKVIHANINELITKYKRIARKKCMSFPRRARPNPLAGREGGKAGILIGIINPVCRQAGITHKIDLCNRVCYTGAVSKNTMKTSTNRAFLFAIAITIGTFLILEPKAILAAGTSDYPVVESAGILPTNPFYFVKKFGWNVRRLFTFNPIKRLDLELEIVEQNVAEFKKLEDINLDSNRSLEKAAVAYEKNLDRFQFTLDDIKADGGNSQLEKTVSNIIEQGLKHQEVFNRLKDKHESMRDRLEEVQLRLRDVVSTAPKITNSGN